MNEIPTNYNFVINLSSLGKPSLHCFYWFHRNRSIQRTNQQDSFNHLQNSLYIYFLCSIQQRESVFDLALEQCNDETNFLSFDQWSRVDQRTILENTWLSFIISQICQRSLHKLWFYGRNVACLCNLASAQWSIW